MRLIDADELGKKVDGFCEIGMPCYFKGQDVCKTCIVTKFRNAIDNAPTVELDGYVLYGTGLELVSTDWLDEQLGKDRRRGEWIDHSDEGYVECPFCGSATNCEDNKDELHYCWNCGAKMGGDTK